MIFVACTAAIIPFRHGGHSVLDQVRSSFVMTVTHTPTPLHNHAKLTSIQTAQRPPWPVGSHLVLKALDLRTFHGELTDKICGGSTNTALHLVSRALTAAERHIHQ